MKLGPPDPWAPLVELFGLAKYGAPQMKGFYPYAINLPYSRPRAERSEGDLYVKSTVKYGIFNIMCRNKYWNTIY